MILHKLSFGPLETNTILIACRKTKKSVVIDPAYQSGNTMIEYAESLDLTIEKILLTHSHWDHFADAYYLREKTAAALYIHPLDVKNLDFPGSDGIPLFVPVHSVEYDHFVTEGDEIQIGTLSFRVIHTPGHSPGSVCYYCKESRLLISGDSLFKGTIGNLSLPTGDPDQMWPSLKKLALLPSETRVVPGHGDDTTIGDESWLVRAKEIFT